MPTGCLDLSPHLPPFKISLVHRQRDYPKAYVLTADSFVSYALISVEITVHMYLKVRLRRRTRTRTCPTFLSVGFCAPSAQARPVICWQFPTMSSDPPDTNAYSFAYKTAVYDNIFVGIVYGRQSLPFPFFTASGSCIVCLPPQAFTSSSMLYRSTSFCEI
jgi:hypothetical protein